MTSDPASIPWDKAVVEAKATDVIEDIQERFTSGNAVPVERAFIRATEWTILMRWIDQLIMTVPNDEQPPSNLEALHRLVSPLLGENLAHAK